MDNGNPGHVDNQTSIVSRLNPPCLFRLMISKTHIEKTMCVCVYICIGGMYDSFYFSKCLNFKIFDVRFPRAAGLHFIPKNLRTDPTKKKRKEIRLASF